MRISVTLFRTLAFTRFAPRAPLFVYSEDIVELDEELIERYRVEGHEVQQEVAEILKGHFTVEEEVEVELQAQADLPAYLYRVNLDQSERHHAMEITAASGSKINVGEVLVKDIIYGKFKGAWRPVRSKYKTFNVTLSGRADLRLPKSRIVFEVKRRLPEVIRHNFDRLKIASSALQAYTYAAALNARRAYIVGRGKYYGGLIAYEVPRRPITYRCLWRHLRIPIRFDRVLEALIQHR